MQFFMVSQFLMLFMMIPVIIPSTFASYSIVGEKTTHTLEPLLATPIKTIELLFGKVLAAFIPAIVATLLSYGIFVISLLFTVPGTGIISQVLSPMWLGAIFGVGGLLSVAGVCIAIMISSRTNDPRVAEQLSGFLVIPFVGLMMAQSFGVITINQIMVLWFILIAIVLDAILLFIATQFFDRETILTRWK
jgi:ABC-2 type transport system permease protein